MLEDVTKEDAVKGVVGKWVPPARINHYVGLGLVIDPHITIDPPLGVVGPTSSVEQLHSGSARWVVAHAAKTSSVVGMIHT